MADAATRALPALVGNLSPERPLVTVFETFQRGGHKKAYGKPGRFEFGDYVAVYPEWVIEKTIITPDSDGLAVSMTGETWSADGTPPVVRSLFDDSVVTGVPDRDPVSRFEEPWDLIGWMDAQLTRPHARSNRTGATPTQAGHRTERPSEYPLRTPYTGISLM